MPGSLDDFKALEALSQQMLNLAIRQDFDGLAALAPSYNALGEKITRLATPSDISDSAEVIGRILEHQEKVGAHLAPWLSHVSNLLRQERREQALNSAYGNVP